MEDLNLQPFLKLVELHNTRPDEFGVFGVILFTIEHPYVAKVLRDDDQWKALSAAAGPRWPIFAIRPYAGNINPVPAPGNIRYLYNLEVIKEWQEPDDNLKLLEAFQIDSTRALPTLLVFTTLPGGERLQMQWPFPSGTSQDDCFNKLLPVVKSASEAISEVTNDNLKHNQEVFDLIKSANIQHRVLAALKNGVSIVQWVKSLKGLFA